MRLLNPDLLLHSSVIVFASFGALLGDCVGKVSGCGFEDVNEFRISRSNPLPFDAKLYRTNSLKMVKLLFYLDSFLTF